ncbi:hypothetical protein ZWY2020_048592 [Hordeum vulgare]|nr:hypothetical protein ZWY2020_048592 [Hordeum vulgare]
MDFAYAYIMGNQGIHTDGDYPYLMEEGDSKEKQPHSKVVTISGYEGVLGNDGELLKALAHQPVSVGIAAGSRDFQFYKGGVRKEQSFDIILPAGRKSHTAVRKQYIVPVTKNFLEIHLFWAGKGTCCIPTQGYYGPAISALSATPSTSLDLK